MLLRKSQREKMPQPAHRPLSSKAELYKAIKHALNGGAMTRRELLQRLNATDTSLWHDPTETGKF